MRSFQKILLSSVAALALTSSVAFAQDSEDSNILNDTLDSVTDTVDSTVDGLNDTVDNAVDGNLTDTLDSTTEGLTNSGDVGGDTEGSVGDVTGSIGDTGNLSDVGNFEDLLSVMEAGNTDLSDIADVSDIQVVDVADVANFDANAFNDALNGNASNISALQDAISGNSALNDFLSGNSIDVSDVVGLSNDQDGSLIVYTDSSED